MNKIPLPTDLPWEVQLLFWVLMLLLGIVFALCVWFLIRHIKQQDDQFGKVETTINGLKTEMTAVKTKVSEGNERVVTEANELRKATLTYQQQMAGEVLEIKKDVLKIEQSVSRTEEKASELRKSVEAMNGSIVKISETVTAHHESLSKGAQAMVVQRDKMNKLETEQIQLAKDVILIRDKHKPSGSKS